MQYHNMDIKEEELAVNSTMLLLSFCPLPPEDICKQETNHTVIITILTFLISGFCTEFLMVVILSLFIVQQNGIETAVLMFWGHS